MLANPGRREWTTLAGDVAALADAHVYGEQLRTFIVSVAAAAPRGDRVDALAAIAALPSRHADTVLAALADRLEDWHDWPGTAAWAKKAMPDLIVRYLPDLAWQDSSRLLNQLRAFADDDTVRRAVLLALPEARTRLTAYGWQNIAALLGTLCPPAAAAAALTGLLDDRAAGGGAADTPEDVAAPIPTLLWSAFGHPRREMRWRAAHATRELLANPDPAMTAPLAATLVQCLDHGDPGAFRDHSLHFYSLSAAAGLLVALQRVASDRPDVLAPHLNDLIRHATSRDLPHAQIRELARQAALAVADPADPRIATLGYANRPTCCLVRRARHHHGSDRRVSDHRRYRFDQMDTLPYWYAPLARVFDIPVDAVAELAEAWILDRWGLGEDDWWTDARELRDQRSWQRTSHRQGSIPPEEKLQLYIEYHAMMAAAGELAEAGRPTLIGTWEAEDGDPWEYWLSPHMPAIPKWLADLRASVPVEAALFGRLAPIDETWDSPALTEHDEAFGLKDGQLTEDVLVAASASLHRPGGHEDTYIKSALVRPDSAQDLQRALAAAANPTDWKLPDEGEADFEVDHGAFELRGWLIDPVNHRDTLDEHDPYAHGLQPALPLPGRRFREITRATPDPSGLKLLAQDRNLLAWAEQWADPGTDDRDRAVWSSGYRVHVPGSVLLRHLADTGTVLIVEVQLGRHRSDAGVSEYRPPRSRIYLVRANGRVTRS